MENGLLIGDIAGTEPSPARRTLEGLLSDALEANRPADAPDA